VRRGVVMVGVARVAAFRAFVLGMLSLAHTGDGSPVYVRKKAHRGSPLRLAPGLDRLANFDEVREDIRQERGCPRMGRMSSIPLCTLQR
jgi:hypothetical protein